MQITKKFFKIMFLSFFLFFLWLHPFYGIWKFPGQGLNLSHGCGNVRSFNPLCQDRDWSCASTETQLLSHSGNSKILKCFYQPDSYILISLAYYTYELSKLTDSLEYLNLILKYFCSLSLIFSIFKGAEYHF